MMAEQPGEVEVKLPKLGASMQQATLISWLRGVGDNVEEREALAEIETDKVDAVLESPAAGLVVELCVREGDTVLVGEVVARLAMNPK